MEGINFVAGDQEVMGITWDSSVPGLGLRKNKRSKVWILKFRNNNKQVMKVLGPADMLSRDEARALAKSTKWDAKQGKLPKPPKRLNAMSVERFCVEYMERHAKPRKKSWKKDQRRIDYYLLEKWGKRRLADISTADIAQIHSEIGKTAPIAANRLLEQLHKMFKLAATWNYYPADAINPAAGIERYKETRKTRWLTKSELERVMPLIDALPKHRATYFWLLILTSCRKSEILQLRWENVDLKHGNVFFEDTKNGEPYLMPLPSRAVDMLRELPQHGDWVFPGRKPGEHWKRPDKIWWKIRKAAGLDGVKLHALRHTVATRLLEKKYPLKTIGAVLKQKSLQATDRYAHAANEHLREVLEDHASDLPDSRSA